MKKYLFPLLKCAGIRLVATLLVLSGILALLSIANAWCLQNILDIAAGESAFSIGLAFLLSLLVFLSTGSLNVLFSYIQRQSVLKSLSKIRKRFLSSLLNLNLSDYEAYSEGDIQTRLFEDVEISAKIIPIQVVTLLSGALSCIACLVYAFYLSWQLTLVVIILTPLAALFTKRMAPVVEKKTVESREAYSKTRSFVQEILGNSMVTRVFHLNRYFTSKYETLNEAFCKADLRQCLYQSLVVFGGSFLGSLSMVCSIVGGAILVMNQEMKIGAIVGFLQLLNFIVWPFTELMGQVTDIRSSTVSLHRIDALLAKSNQGTDVVNVQSKEPVASLSIKDLSFSYESTHTNLFHHLNFAVKAPGVLMIRGKSGAGKTTLLKLLLGLYQPNSGEICYTLSDGTRITKDFSGLCAFVPQDHMLFSGTIRENIILDRQISDGALQKIIEQGQLAEFIASLPNGIDTLISEDAKNISFGQGQRIVFARALATQAQVLVFDEPTASLDRNTKEEIMKAIRNVAKKKLCIIVSHDEMNMEPDDCVLSL